MRFIKTTPAQVEALKKKAKRLQRNGGGQHTVLLDRVARGAGYDHWHHVKLCLAGTEQVTVSRRLLPEIDGIVQAAQDGVPKIVMTGPEALASRQFVLMSTDDGDAWLLDPEEDRALCLAWHGVRQEVIVRDLPTRLEIEWDGRFSLSGPFFSVETDHAEIGSRFIAGYPVDRLRECLEVSRSADKLIQEIFGREDAVALSPEVIRQLVRKGWQEETLVEAAGKGAQYSPSRDTVLLPVQGEF